MRKFPRGVVVLSGLDNSGRSGFSRFKGGCHVVEGGALIHNVSIGVLRLRELSDGENFNGRRSRANSE